MLEEYDAIVYDEKVTTMMASCRQRLRWAQGSLTVRVRYIPKLFAIGIKQEYYDLDGIFQVSQPYFLLLTTVYLVLSYINAYTPIYTNILYQIMPMSVWTIIGVVNIYSH